MKSPDTCAVVSRPKSGNQLLLAHYTREAERVQKLLNGSVPVHERAGLLLYLEACKAQVNRLDREAQREDKQVFLNRT